MRNERRQSFVAKKNSSQADLDQATATLHQAEANVKIKQGALDKAKADLDHCTITSPIDGIVISRSVDVGQTVAASLQAPVIFTIANDLAKMQIDANVAEADVGVVAVGQNVDFTVDAFPTRTFHGKVVQVRNAPITVQNVVTYDTVIGVNNADLKLKPGMTANVSIIVAHKDNVLQIKNAALRYRPADATPSATRPPGTGVGGRPPGGRKMGAPERNIERTVYLLKAGASAPEPAQIKTGISDGIVTEVIDGLKEGDQVVTAELTSTSDASILAGSESIRHRPTSFLVIDMNNGALVKLIDVQKIYRTGEMEVRAVRGVSLEIRRGEFVALMGSSGSGKSTLMNILGCLDRLSVGRYILDDSDVSGLNRDALADIRNRKIGFIFQNFNLLPRTSARENVELPLLYGPQQLTNSQLSERADRVLASVGLEGREDHHPSQLSGGQQQRVAIARALVNEPEVILADEPTGNLDSRTSIEIMGIFQQLNERGITIIMVTHEPDIAAYARRNVIMRDGLILNDFNVVQRFDAATELAKIGPIDAPAS